MMQLEHAKRLAEEAGGSAAKLHDVFAAAAKAKGDQYSKLINHVKGLPPEEQKKYAAEITDRRDHVTQAKTLHMDHTLQAAKMTAAEQKSKVNQANAESKAKEAEIGLTQTKIDAANTVMPHAKKSASVAVDVFKAVHAPEPTQDQAPGKPGLSAAKETAKKVPKKP